MARSRHLLSGALGVSLLVLAATAGRAEEVDKAAKDSFKSIITQQIDAFTHDDATTAESFAAPGIQARFPDPKDFVEMVKRAYSPLVGPRSTHFDETDTNSFGPMQKVTVVDHDGGVWTAVYTFEQVDGQWRITGCSLVKEQSTTI